MNVDSAAKRIWEYMILNQEIKPADVILVLGSRDLDPARYAVELFKKGYGKYVIFSGGVLFPESTMTEAEEYKKIALALGVPEEVILMENESTNTGANLEFTRKLLEKKGLEINSFIIVQKPYMERRVYALAAKQWPDKKVMVTSKPVSYEEYVEGSVPKDKTLNTMVGDLQRIKVYGENGFQIPQDIPTDVWEAYQYLVKEGYDKRLVKTDAE